VKIEEHMHFLKGAALNLGFEALARICQQGETEAATNAPPRVGAEDVQSCFTASREAFLRDLPARLAA
jgi:HPt (histidine-containing phosphotransfer) domain-containing protein